MGEGKRILLIVSGGIAAYKCLDAIRRLREHGLAVRCILTRAGAEFVTPMSLAALSQDKVYEDLFSLTDESEMGHIELSRDADLVLVAPATTNILAKMAAGIADDLATTALLATDKPVMVAPASMAPSTATRAAGSKAVAPGLSMMRMPMNPTTVAVARRQRTTSPSTTTAKMVVNSGRENKMALASASAMWDKA